MTISGCTVSVSGASTNSFHRSLLLYTVSIYDAFALIYNVYNTCYRLIVHAIHVLSLWCMLLTNDACSIYYLLALNRSLVYSAHNIDWYDTCSTYVQFISFKVCLLRGRVIDLWCIPLHVIDDIDQLGFPLIITSTRSVPHVFIGTTCSICGRSIIFRSIIYIVCYK